MVKPNVVTKHSRAIGTKIETGASTPRNSCIDIANCASRAAVLADSQIGFHKPGCGE